jgi:outer membrane biosynthesis protein TonB
MSRARANRSPALLASALIHAGVIAAAIISWPFFAKPLQIGKVVPVTIVTNAPPAELAPAVQAPTPAPAMTPAPEPQAPAAPAPITPAPPTPPPKPAAPPKPAPQPKPTPAKQAPASKPSPAAKASPAKDNFFEQTTAAIAGSTQRASTRASAGEPGPNRPRTDTVAQQGQGADDKMSGSELGALKEKLGRLWNPNCQVEGARGIVVRVHVRLTAQGYVIGQPELVDRDKINSSGNPILIAAATRALSAVGRGQPYADVLNPEHYAAWKDMILKFDARDQCG